MEEKRKQRFLELLEPVYPRLYRYALAMTRNRDEAKDLVGEAVLQALERFETIRDETGFPGFLYRIVSRTHRHSRQRNRRFIKIEDMQIETILDTAAMPDMAAEIAVVRAALDTLPVKMKEAILLFDVADLSLKEIRTIQGGTLSGVKTRLRRGRAMLRSILGMDTESGKQLYEEIPARSHDDKKNIMMEAIEHYAL